MEHHRRTPPVGRDLEILQEIQRVLEFDRADATNFSNHVELSPADHGQIVTKLDDELRHVKSIIEGTADQPQGLTRMGVRGYLAEQFKERP